LVVTETDEKLNRASRTVKDVSSDVPDVSRPIFIVGTGRCGTTLLARLLNQATDVSAIFEIPMLARWLRYARDGRVPSLAQAVSCRDDIQALLADRGMRILVEPASLDISRRLSGIETSGQFRGVVTEWCDAFHFEHLASSSDRIIVHKTPALAAVADQLLENWPNGRIVHIVRDPRDVLGSALRNGDGESTLVDLFRRMAMRLTVAFSVADDPRVLTIRYEDLLHAPAHVLGRVALHTGISMNVLQLAASSPLWSHTVGTRRWNVGRRTERSMTRALVAAAPDIAYHYPDLIHWVFNGFLTDAGTTMIEEWRPESRHDLMRESALI